MARRKVKQHEVLKRQVRQDAKKTATQTFHPKKPKGLDMPSIFLGVLGALGVKSSGFDGLLYGAVKRQVRQDAKKTATQTFHPKKPKGLDMAFNLSWSAWSPWSKSPGF